MLQDIGGLLALSNCTFSISYKPGRNNTDADALSRIQWPEAVDISSQTVQAVCEGVQAPHGKVETLCHGAQAVGILSQDTMPAGMTSLEWSQAADARPCNKPYHSGHSNQTFKYY